MRDLLPVAGHILGVAVVNVQYTDIGHLHGDDLCPVPARIDGVLDTTGNSCETRRRGNFDASLVITATFLHDIYLHTVYFSSILHNTR